MNAIPENIVELADQRQLARINKDFSLSDSLREQIATLGWLIKDTPEGFILSVAPPFVQFATTRQLIESAQNSIQARTVLLVVVDGWPADTRTAISALANHLPSDSCVVAIDCGNVDGAGEVLHELAAAAGSALHDAVQRLGPIGGLGVFLPRGFSCFDDLGLVQTKIIPPAPNMLPRWPTLPPAGQGALGVKAQRRE